MNLHQPSRNFGLKTVDKKTLRQAIRKAATRGHLDWKKDYSRADQVIVFGSWALGLQRTGSDIDVLCIGKGRRSTNSSLLHILWMSPARFEKHVRRGSELACHVAAFGVWIKGSRTIPDHISPSSDTIRRRRNQIHARFRALMVNWPILRFEFKKKHASKIRRDLQRLTLLNLGQPNIPAPALDREWSKTQQRSRYFPDWLVNGANVQAACAADLIRLIRS